MHPAPDPVQQPPNRIQRLRQFSGCEAPRTHCLLDLPALTEDENPLPPVMHVQGRVRQCRSSGHTLEIELVDRDAALWVLLTRQQVGAEAWEVLLQDLSPGDLIGCAINRLGWLDTYHLASIAADWWLIAGCEYAFPPAPTDPVLQIISDAKRRERVLRRLQMERVLRRTLEYDHGLYEIRPSFDYATTQHTIRQLVGSLEAVYAVTERPMPGPACWHTAPHHTMLVGGLAPAGAAAARHTLEHSIRTAVKRQHSTLQLPVLPYVLLHFDGGQRADEEILLDFAAGWTERTVSALLEEATGDNPLTYTSPTRVLNWAQAVSDHPLPAALVNARSRAHMTDLIWYVLEHVILPELTQPTVVTGFTPAYVPAAAYRQTAADTLDYFVMVANGLPIAQGGTLITDPCEQITRWSRLEAAGMPVASPAEQQALLLTLRYGQPPGAAFALDLDRLALLLVGGHSIAEVRL